MRTARALAALLVAMPLALAVSHRGHRTSCKRAYNTAPSPMIGLGLPATGVAVLT